VLEFHRKVPDPVVVDAPLPMVNGDKLQTMSAA